MSNVKRYAAAGDGVVRTDEEGPLVLHSDYARLKADAQVILKHLDEASADSARLKAEYDDATRHYNGIINKFEAEVERLRKDSEYERKYREVLAVLKQHNL